jgi:glucosamine--fructose-6-phosphate aminotransferase (isomerizing)
MCGIVGYIGSKNAVDVVLEGLKRLEYRGYDSAGISFKDVDGKSLLYKKAGKLENLEKEVEGKDCYSNIAIGHTRWATHGEVNDENSHPHIRGSISVVHNGIIENADDLKNSLKKKDGFLSETDSEVFVALVEEEIDNGCDFFKAVANSFKKIRGNSAFVVLDIESNTIISIKRGAPLVCGEHKKSSQLFVSSDPYALIGHAESLYFPGDKVMCVLNGKEGGEAQIQFFDLAGKPTDNVVKKKQESLLEVSDKGDFEHYMLKEIYDQPTMIRSLVNFYQGPGLKIIQKASKLDPKRIYIIGCGTAYYAGLVIKDFIEANNRISCEVFLASEFRYRNPIMNKGDIGIFISQSGETADTLAAQALCKESGIKTLSIVNTDGSTLTRECDENLLIRAGVEICVCSTKAFTQMSLTGRLLSEAISSTGNLDKMFKNFLLLADRIEDLLSDVEEIKKVAENIYNFKGYFFTGRGQYFPVALEGALKLKEIAYVHAEGYASGELKHGPFALIDEEMVNIAVIGPELYDKTLSNIEEFKTRKGIIVSLGPKDDKRLATLSNYYLPFNFKGLNELSPLLVNVGTQLVSYYMAKFKGTDIDKPRNLAKSVTVE